MSDEAGSQVKRRPLRKVKTKAPETVLSIAETFEVANTKDKDFDLDLACANFQGKKGQAGTRTKAVA